VNRCCRLSLVFRSHACGLGHPCGRTLKVFSTGFRESSRGFRQAILITGNCFTGHPPAGNGLQSLSRLVVRELAASGGFQLASCSSEPTSAEALSPANASSVAGPLSCHVDA